MKKICHTLIICCSLFVMGIPSIEAEVFKIDGVLNVFELPGNEGNLYLKQLSNNMAAENPADGSVGHWSINMDLVYQEGVQLSFPVHYVVETNDQNEVIRYRVEFIPPTVDVMDPNFTPQNPTLLYNSKFTHIVDIINEKRYTKEENLETGAIQEEVDDHLLFVSYPERWVFHLNDIQKELKNATPIATVGNLKQFNLKNAEVYLSNNDSDMEVFNQNKKVGYLKYKFPASGKIPGHFEQSANSFSLVSDLSIQKADSEALKNSLTIPEINK